jgi:putative transposase
MALLIEKEPISGELRTSGNGNVDKMCHLIRSQITFPEFPRIDTTPIIQASIAIACEKMSISGFCTVNSGLPSHTTCLKALHQLDMDEMIRESTSILKKAGKNVIKPGKGYYFAIDKTDDPYYGEIDKTEKSYTVGGKRKASTNYFFSYLTLSIIDIDRHITLFAIPWHSGMKNCAAIQDCIKVIYALNLKIKGLCIDREFYAAEIFSYLQYANIPHIIPVKEHGALLKSKLKGKKSNTFKYCLKSKSENPVEVTITDCLVYLKGKKGKHGLKHHAFVVFGISPSPRLIRGIYKHRFAIESTYRLRNTTKPKTSSKDPVLRYYYTLVAFICQNWWISLKWRHFVKNQRGPKVIDRKRFSLQHFVKIISSELQDLFVVHQISEIAIFN